jgi:pimeloyl-ACP methyl ester carboxylesterase
VHTFDRRGRGASGDGPSYDLAREFEDVAAVIDAAAASAGGLVDVLGHSFGGTCAFGAAALTSNIRRLVLYEGWPATNPDVWAVPAGVEQELEDHLADGRNEAVLETFLRRIVRMPEAELAVYRSLPVWPARIAAAGTIPRELAAEAANPFRPELAALVTVPTLLLVGGDSHETLREDAALVAAALPDARITTLAGQRHIAMDLDPQGFAAEVLSFLHEPAAA